MKIDHTRTRVWIGTSWKMNKTIIEAQSYLESLDLAHVPACITPFVMPPLTALATLATAPNRDSRLLLGAQNAYWGEEGAVTGEVSMRMIKDAGAQLVEIGHSERREFFGESDQDVARKVHAAVDQGITPLICVGESQAVRSAGDHVTFVRNQVEQALSLLDPTEHGQAMFAYEPRWAIGEFGRKPAVAEVAQVLDQLALQLEDLGNGVQIPLLYGGSVDAENARDLVELESVDGLFIGRSAWSVDAFNQILMRCGAIFP